MSNENNDKWWKPWLKALGVFVAVLLLLAVVGFGLLFGFCALGSKF